MSEQEEIVAAEPQTGDEITLKVETLGRACNILVNGQSLPGVQAFRLSADLHGATKLEIDAVWPWPPVIEGRGKETHAHSETFMGYFISQEDMMAFRAWLRRES